MTSPTELHPAPLLYTSEQTAKMLNISTKTLREFVKAGEIAYVPLGKGQTKPRLGFHIDDINDFIKRRRTRDSPPPTRPARVKVKNSQHYEILGFTERMRRRDAEKAAQQTRSYDIMELRKQREAEKAERKRLAEIAKAGRSK